MSDLFVVAEAHPYWPSPSSWRDDDPFVLVMGVDNPSALAVWVLSLIHISEPTRPY